MESRSGDTADPRGSRGGGKQQLRRPSGSGSGHGPGDQRCSPGGGHPLRAGLSARQLLARLDARPLAARAAADVSALVRRAGATLRLRPKEVISVLDSADIEVTDSRLPHATLVEHRLQHHRSETLGACTAPLEVTQHKPSSTSKPPQTSGRFSVELVRSPAGFGLTLSGGRGLSGDAPLAVQGLLKDGPAQRCGLLQAGDLVLCINGESTQGLTHAQVVERIHVGGHRLHLVLRRPQETHPGQLEGVGGPQDGDPRSPEMMKSCSASISPVHHPRSGRMPKPWGSPEPSPEAVVNSSADAALERCTEDLDDHILGSPGPWLVPSEERLSRALGVPGATQIAQETAAGRWRH